METPKNIHTRTLVLIVIALLAAFCLCLCLLTVLGAGWFWFNDESLTLTSSPEPMQSLNQQMDEIQQQVALLRGLAPTMPVTRTLISSEQLRLNVTEEFLNDYSPEEAQQDALILSAFGLLEQDFDLLDFYMELYTEQIAGYYDQETKEMFVVQGSGFNGPERLTYAHEYTHVLQDQAYDIHKGLRFNDDDCEESSERCMGLQALLEGDASLLELQWFEQYATTQDRSQLMDSVSGTTSPIYNNAPAFMKEDFVFPYTQGYAFVEYLYESGGWNAVDRAYLRPPVSSEQILHPELYPAEAPLEIPLPDSATLLGTDWIELEQGVMGEWYTFLILAHGFDSGGQININQAQKASAGWGGDAFIVYSRQEDQSLVMYLISEWDSETDAQEFEQAFKTHLNGRFGHESASIWMAPNGQHYFARQGTRTTWLLAPDAKIATPLWNLLTSP